MKLAPGFAKTCVVGLVLASLAVSLPGVAAADHKQRRHQKRHHREHRTEYVLHVRPASYQSCGHVRHVPVRYTPPPVPGYYYDRDCDRRFSNFDVSLEHARRHGHTRLVFVVSNDRPMVRSGSGWGGWVRVSW